MGEKGISIRSACAIAVLQKGAATTKDVVDYVSFARKGTSSNAVCVMLRNMAAKGQLKKIPIPNSNKMLWQSTGKSTEVAAKPESQKTPAERLLQRIKSIEAKKEKEGTSKRFNGDKAVVKRLAVGEWDADEVNYRGRSIFDWGRQ